jgi:hypothetical protein
VLAAAALLLVVPIAGAASVRTVRAPAPVATIAADWPFVAYATGRSAHDCNRVYIWNLATRAVSKFGRRTHCVQTSTGNAVGSVAVAGRRVLWIHYAGGNRRNYTLWTATTTRPQPLLLGSREVDVDDPAPMVVGEGDNSPRGSLLPYAVGNQVVALRANGSRAFAWTASARVVSLGARAGQLAVATDDATVTVLSERGRILRVERYASPVQEVRLTWNTIAAQRGRTLELRGGHNRTWTLPAGTRLADAAGNRALAVGGGRVYTVDLRTGAVRVVTSGTAGQVEDARIAVGAGRIVSVR